MIHYYISEDGKQSGPFNTQQLSLQKIKPETLLWCEGMLAWQRADTFSELMHIFGAPLPQNNLTYGPGRSSPDMYGYVPANLRANAHGASVASLVLGIISVSLFCLWFLSIPCAILAIVLGAVKLKHPPSKSYAVAGMICGIVTLSVVLGFFVLIVATAGKH